MNQELISIWANVKEMFKIDLEPITYNTWISRLHPVDYNGKSILINAPNAFTQKMVEQKYKDNIKKYLYNLLELNIEVIITEPCQDIKSLSNIKEDEPSYEALFNRQKKEEKDEFKYDDPVAIDDLPNNIKHVKRFNKYTFDNFVEGKSNELALSAARAVSKAPGQAYNPLFIYGGAGLGKTHLMNAIASSITDNFPEKKVVYLSSETFTNDLISSINTRKNREFRKKYREVDVLLIDDIQFIAGKTGTQEEFFHTFNDLYNSNKQIVISSDRPPMEIKTLEERLKSRFNWGLLTDIQEPDFETRVAILNKKIEMEKLNIPREVLEYIAMNIQSNIRELEGALIKVEAYANLRKVERIDLDFAKNALKKIIQKSETKVITIDFIKESVARFYGIGIDDLESKARARQIAFPRQIAMYIARKQTDLSLIKIADSFNRDHSTVSHGIDKIEEQLKDDLNLYDEINEILETLK